MPTQRDKIWSAVFQVIETNRTFSAADIRAAIDTNPPSTRTIRDTLDAMEALGHLDSIGGSGRAPREYYAQPPDDALTTPGYSSRDSSPSSPIPYPGAKGRIADWIISQMPAHDTYVEVFGGTAGVLFAKPQSKYEIYNDGNQDLAQFFRVLRNRPEELATWLMSVPYSRVQYSQWVDAFYSGERPSDPVERAGRFFSLRYMQYIGVSGSPNGFKARARRSPARTFDNARRRLRSLAERFSEVTIENREYDVILSDYDDDTVDVLFYVDPPYRETANQYDPAFDYDRFVECLQDVGNDWLLSCAVVPSGLEEYTVIERETRRRMTRSGEPVTERLVCNYIPEDRRSFTEMYSET